MIHKNTEDSLGIFWKGEECDGIIVYGCFKGNHTQEMSFDSTIWPCTETSTYKILDESWTVWLIDIKISEWPTSNNWFSVLDKIFTEILAQGAIVAWAGVEGGFVDPLHLFNPEKAAFGVWALKTKPEGFFCDAYIGEKFRFLDKTVLNIVGKKLLEAPDGNSCK
jgi:hypothetical protein